MEIQKVKCKIEYYSEKKIVLRGWVAKKAEEPTTHINYRSWRGEKLFSIDGK